MLGYFSSGSLVAFSGLNLTTKFLKIPKNSEKKKKMLFNFLFRKKYLNVRTTSQKCTEIVLVKLFGQLFWLYCLKGPAVWA